MNPTSSSTATILCADAGAADQFEVLSKTTEANSGRVIGADGVHTITAFDSASAAVTAGIEMQQALVDAHAAAPLRIGLATGDVVWNDGKCVGAPVGIAIELFDRARPGQILVTNVVRWLAASGTSGSYSPVGPIEIDGTTEPIEMFAVEWQ